MGSPVLHAPAEPVDEITDDVRQLVADMFETMDAAPGVGLAAPQVGVGLRIYTYSYQDDDGEPLSARFDKAAGKLELQASAMGRTTVSLCLSGSTQFGDALRQAFDLEA